MSAPSRSEEISLPETAYFAVIDSFIFCANPQEFDRQLRSLFDSSLYNASPHHPK